MYHTQINRIRSLSSKEYDILKDVTHYSKNLYNQANYEINKYFELNNDYYSYSELCKIGKDLENYIKMPSQVAQQTLKVVIKNWRSFFRLLGERKKGNYNRRISPPRYLKKDGYFPCIFQKQSFKIVENNQVRLSLGRWFSKHKNIRYLFFDIPDNVIEQKIKEIRLLPRYSGIYFEIAFIYDKKKVNVDLNEKKYLGIDLGIDNFATCVTNESTFIMEGKGIKSYNRWWNKQKSKLQSIYDKQDVKFGKKMAKLLYNRKNKMKNFMAQNVNYIVTHCIKHQIGNIIIGELKNIKQNGKLCKKNNQNFQSIPYGLFKSKLKSKCELYGIQFQQVSESYTSQMCCRCNRKNKSNRKHRGLYVCDKCHSVLNADTNGAMNIVKKVVPDFLNEIGNSGFLNNPERIRLVI